MLKNKFPQREILFLILAILLTFLLWDGLYITLLDAGAHALLFMLALYTILQIISTESRKRKSIFAIVTLACLGLTFFISPNLAQTWQQAPCSWRNRARTNCISHITYGTRAWDTAILENDSLYWQDSYRVWQQPLNRWQMPIPISVYTGLPFATSILDSVQLDNQVLLIARTIELSYQSEDGSFSPTILSDPYPTVIKHLVDTDSDEFVISVQQQIPPSVRDDVSLTVNADTEQDENVQFGYVTNNGQTVSLHIKSDDIEVTYASGSLISGLISNNGQVLALHLADEGWATWVQPPADAKWGWYSAYSARTAPETAPTVRFPNSTTWDCVQLSPDGQTLFVLSEQTVHFFNTETGEQKQASWAFPENGATCGWFSDNGRLLATLDIDQPNKLHLYAYPQRDAIQTWIVDGHISSVQFSPNQQYIAITNIINGIPDKKSLTVYAIEQTP